MTTNPSHIPSPVREMVIPADFDQLAAVADFLCECCDVWQIDEDTQFAIQLAVDEAVANVIAHAYTGQPGRIHLCCWTANGDFHVELQDQGRAFDPAAVPPPDLTGPLEERREGGLGLHFMRQVMDEVEFDFSPTGNRLHMIKRGARQ